MKKPESCAASGWFGGERTAGLRAFGHRSRMRQLGVEPEEHLGKPLIPILNTWSEINPCHMHLRQRAEQVKRGVLEAAVSRSRCRSPPSPRRSRSRPR